MNSIYDINKYRTPDSLASFINALYSLSNRVQLDNFSVSEVSTHEVNVSAWFMRKIKKAIAITDGYSEFIAVNKNEELHIYCLHTSRRVYLLLEINGFLYNTAFRPTPIYLIVTGEHLTISGLNTEGFYVAITIIRCSVFENSRIMALTFY